MRLIPRFWKRKVPRVVEVAIDPTPDPVQEFIVPYENAWGSDALAAEIRGYKLAIRGDEVRNKAMIQSRGA